MLGSNLSAAGPTNGGTDFTLLLLAQKPSSPRWYLGWTTAPAYDGDILHSAHHPAISPLQKYTRSVKQSPQSTCTGTPTSWYHYTRVQGGQTAGGSSGGPIVNPSSQVVGQLLGICPGSANDCEFNTYHTVWGRFDVSYINYNLSYWLLFGAEAQISISPSALGFGTQPIGSPTTLMLMVTNISTRFDGLNLEAGEASISGPHASEFSILGNTSLYIPPQSSRTFTVMFSPTSVGSKSATLVIPHNAINASSPLLVQLTGTAVNPAPVLSSISPSSAIAGSPEFTLRVFGGGFVSSSVVRWNGNGRPTQYVGSGELRATIPESDVAAAGEASVTVFTPIPGGGTSNPLTFTINNPEPSISLLSPSSAIAGQPGFVLTVNGSNFITQSIVRWNQSDRVTTFVDGSRLTAEIPASDIANPGTASVTVFNPAPGGGTSNSAAFPITVPIILQVTVDQRNQSNEQLIGTEVGRWEGGPDFAPYPVPIELFDFTVGTREILRGHQERVNNPGEKYRVWERNQVAQLDTVQNHRGFTIRSDDAELVSRFHPTQPTITIKTDLIELPGTTGGNVQFRDPWYIDSLDAAHGDSPMNRGMQNAVFRNRESTPPDGFKPNFDSPFPPLNQPYRGVFLGEQPDPQDPNKPYYSVGAPSGQQIGNFTWNFVNWTTTQGSAAFQNANAAQTGVVFHSSSTTVATRMKAHMGSSTPAALSTNGQRKFARWRHSTVPQWTGYSFVYESAGDIWEVVSSNMGVSWRPERRISTNPGTHRAPSFAYDHYSSHDLTWHTELEGADQIWYSRGGIQPYLVADIARHASIPPAPVLAGRGHEYRSIVAYTRANGIDIRKSSDYGETWPRDGVSDSLDGRYRPSLASGHDNNIVYLAYDSGRRIYFDRYRRHAGGGEGWWRMIEGEDIVRGSISDRSGFRGNAQVLAMPTGAVGRAGVVWEMREGLYITEELPEEEAMEAEVENEEGISISPDEFSVCFQSKEIGMPDWGPLTKFVGNSYRSPSISYVKNERLHWMWTNGQNVFVSQSTDHGTSWSAPVSLHAGVDPHPVLKADDASQPVEYIYRRLSGPIYRVGPHFGIPTPEAEEPEATREMIVEDESVEASLSMEMSLLTVKTTSNTLAPLPFAVQGDSLFIASANNLEEYFGTSAYLVPQDAENIYFSIRLNSKQAAALAQQNAPLRVRLHYSVNGSPRRTAAQWRFTNNHALNKTFRLAARRFRGKEIQFDVSLLGLNRSNSNLRVNVGSVYRMNDVGSAGNKVALEGTQELPQSFVLHQNHPNPFNPSTVIRYQLPVESYVSLKVYDLLGREVATLVNETKDAGFYETTFDASQLGSGVYFYRMSVVPPARRDLVLKDGVSGSFTQVRKFVVMR